MAIVVVATSPDEPFRTENDHEALVSVKNFKLAQRVLKLHVSTGKKRDGNSTDDTGAEQKQKSLLSGMLCCGKCHRMMVISGNSAHCERERIL